MPDSLDPADAEGVLKFGLAAQQQVSVFYDRVLDHVRAKDTRHVRETLEELLRQLKKVNVAQIGNGGVLSRLPMRVPFFRKRRGTTGFFADYEKVSTQVERLAESLDESRTQLLRDVELFDRLYEQNLQHLAALDVHIEAVETKLAEIKRDGLPELKKRLEGSEDALDAHRLSDFEQQVKRLERKAHELKLARTTAIQAAGQIRLFQNGIQALIEGIQGSVLNSVPLWRNQIAIALSHARQKKTLKIQSEIARATADMVRRNTEFLQSGANEAVKEARRAERAGRVGRDGGTMPDPPRSPSAPATPDRPADSPGTTVHARALPDGT